MWDRVGEALLTSAGFLWKALWALVFGYAISGAIQILVPRAHLASMLGERGPRQASLATFFGFVSSSCSFAALAASRVILTKGAHAANALAFLIASTNLVIELGVILWVLVGWRFVVANFLLGLVMVVYAYLLLRIWTPQKLADEARDHAKALEAREQGEMDQGQGVEEMTWREKVTSLRGWTAIANAFVMEWKMAYKEILVGFTIAGLIAVLVPQSFWDALFLQPGPDTPEILAVLQNASVAPFVAFFTFIGSMGNVPLAATLWSKGATFGGVMAFLGADLVAATVVYLHIKYYGWRYAAYLSGLLYLAMVAAGVTVHFVFAAVGLLPTSRPTVGEMARFALDYTLWLNLLFAMAAAALVYLHFRRAHGQEEEQAGDESARHG